MLVFLPGIAEIRASPTCLDARSGRRRRATRWPARCRARGAGLALAPSPPGRRRVVLATDIAETQLTVEGVRVVVDSGLARARASTPAPA